MPFAEYKNFEDCVKKVMKAKGFSRERASAYCAVVERRATGHWPGEKGDGILEKSEWTTAYVNNFPDSSFAYIAPGGKKDAEGKTVPRTNRKLPYKDKGGKIDPPHVRNALARLSQPKTDIPAAAKASAKSKLCSAAKKVGIKSEVCGTTKSEKEYEISSLEGINLDSLGIVGNPAIGRKFLLLKSKRGENMSEFMEKTDDVLARIKKGDEDAVGKAKELIKEFDNAISDEGLEVEKDEIEGLKTKLEEALEKDEVSKDTVVGLIDGLKGIVTRAEETKAAKDALTDEEKSAMQKVLESVWEFKDKLPEAAIKALGDLVGYPEEEDAAANTLNEANLPDDVKEQLLASIGKQTEERKQIEKAYQAKLDEIKKQADEAKAEVAKMVEAKNLSEKIRKAADYTSNISGTPEDIGKLLVSIEKNSKEDAEKVEKILKAANEQLKKSKFFDELGVSTPDEDSPEGKIEKIAKEMVAKDKDMTIDIARGKAWEENPELYKEYETTRKVR